MKFSNGCWLNAEGTECFFPRQVHSYHSGKGEISLCMPTYPVKKRGDALGGVNLTVRISAPYPEVLHIRVAHFLGEQERKPAFPLAQEEEGLLQVSDGDSELEIGNTSGDLRVVVEKCNGHMTFYQGKRKLTASGEKDLAYVKSGWRGLAYDRGPEDPAYLREQLLISVGELFYGLGERFSPFAKNGQSVDLWNEDGGTSTEQSYKNIPFLVSNRGYGIFVDHPEKVSFEVGSENVARLGFSVPGEVLDFYMIGGGSIKKVVQNYCRITGRPSLPPQWSFGLWLSTSFTTDYDEKTVMHFVDGMKERGIPLKVFYFDAYWQKEMGWCDYRWDERIFPDPKGMLAHIHEKGLKVCVWINPYVAQESSIFEEGVRGGYFVKRANGDVWQWDMWQPGLAIIDFTNPEAVRWFESKLEVLMDQGVDCFKTDFGERIPTDCVWYDGSDPWKMHNYYAYLYNKIVFGLVKRKRGEREALVFSRSATTGSQRFPVHWGGDCWSDYESMEQSLRGGLSLTTCGFGFWSHDIGGFENTSTADVYKRWCAFGLLSTHSRLHGSSSYRVPWAYDEEAVAVVRFFARLKNRLMPYLYGQARKTAEYGIPMMRSMPMEYPEDRNCDHLGRQYFLGEGLLVAPVFREDGMAEYYLPEASAGLWDEAVMPDADSEDSVNGSFGVKKDPSGGDGLWTNFLTGEKKEGGKWYREEMDYFHIPLFVKPGMQIGCGYTDEDCEYDLDRDVSYVNNLPEEWRPD